jgi:hypothetical protein
MLFLAFRAHETCRAFALHFCIAENFQGGAHASVLTRVRRAQVATCADGSKHRRDRQLLARLRQVAKLRHHASVEELAEHKPALLLQG